MFKCVHEMSALAQDVKDFKQNGLDYLWGKENSFGSDATGSS